MISKMWRFGIDDARATIMAKFPLRFLRAVAIPVAVIGQLGFADHASADTSPEVAGLLAASKEEMAYEGHVQGFAAYAQKDWEEYTSGLHTINSYIDLANDGVPGDPPPASEWRRALAELGEARKQLCNNAEVELNGRISARAAHLEADKRDLAAVLAAVKDVEEAEQTAEEAEHRAKWLEAMKMVSEVVEAIGNPHDFVEAEAGFASRAPDTSHACRVNAQSRLRIVHPGRSAVHGAGDPRVARFRLDRRDGTPGHDRFGQRRGNRTGLALPGVRARRSAHILREAHPRTIAI